MLLISIIYLCWLLFYIILSLDVKGWDVNKLKYPSRCQETIDVMG